MTRKNLPVQELITQINVLRSVDFKSGKVFHGKGFLPFVDLPRLKAEILNITPDFELQQKGVNYELNTWIDEDSIGGEVYRLQLILHLFFPLECQRCMQAYEELLNIESQFLLLNDEQEVENFPLDNDEEDALLNSHQFDLIELIEDEALLHLPFIPKHDIKDCHPALIKGIGEADEELIHDEENSSKNPFAGLKKLKFNA
jgi:uncharacterized protein